MESRIAVSKAAAILRVADALDRTDSQRFRDIECAIEDGELIITAIGADDVSLEELALQQKGSLFRDVFGLKITLKAAGA